jgi:hypothetical protein
MTAAVGTADRRIALVALCAGYLVAVSVCFRPVQLRVWNSLSGVDVLVMAVLVVPFLVIARPGRPNLRVTRYAWGLCALMALDVLCFALAEFGPRGGGHPSLESLISYFVALAKPVLIPLALILLGIACFKGERLAVVVAGFVCLAGETLYGTYPTSWWGGA